MPVSYFSPFLSPQVSIVIFFICLFFKTGGLFQSRTTRPGRQLPGLVLLFFIVNDHQFSNVGILVISSFIVMFFIFFLNMCTERQ